MKQADIGLIGLAVMGQNLARNIASHNFKVSVYNRTTTTMDDFITEHGSAFLEGYAHLEDFVQSLSVPRKIIIMVKAGKAVDSVIESLLPLLDAGDTIIDCGNSHFPDTITREKSLAHKGYNFIGCGVSGGEDGALNGPSLMPGGKLAVWQQIEPIFSAIAAKDFKGQPCVTYLGENGAGHYTKMVHNGIEYAVMQMMAEAYELLSNSFGLTALELADIFERYNQGVLRSFLFEISVPILRQPDDLTEGCLIDKILDKAGQKGTGRWTAIEGLERGVDISTIIQAVNARTVSSQKDFRVQLAGLYKTDDKSQKLSAELMVDIIPQLEAALYASMLVAYAQGFDLLRQAAKDMNWNLNYAEVARIWQGGCIIRAQILETLHQAFTRANNAPLWQIEAIAGDLKKRRLSLQAVVCLASQSNTPLFCLSAALASFEAITQSKTSANFIQALRDNFGAHTYERVDQLGIFHTEWGK